MFYVLSISVHVYSQFNFECRTTLDQNMCTAGYYIYLKLINE